MQDSNTAPDGLWAGPNVLSRDLVTIAKRIKVPFSAADPSVQRAHLSLRGLCSCPPLLIPLQGERCGRREREEARGRTGAGI